VTAERAGAGRAAIVIGVACFASSCCFVLNDPPRTFDADREPDCRRTDAWKYVDAIGAGASAGISMGYTYVAVEADELGADRTEATATAIASGLAASAFVVSLVREKLTRVRCDRARSRYLDEKLGTNPSCEDWRGGVAAENDPAVRVRIMRDRAPHCFGKKSPTARQR